MGRGWGEGRRGSVHSRLAGRGCSGGVKDRVEVNTFFRLAYYRRRGGCRATVVATTY